MYLLPVTTFVRYSFENSICLGAGSNSHSFTTQSYTGLWSSNSSVQIECVIWIAGTMAWTRSLGHVMMCYPTSWLLGMLLMLLYVRKGKWMDL